ncbi:HipA N-terminal domain-containing protein [Saccharospirillum salsuginis]|uniref:HipA N-terminal subdomain 1 domain-containing protein n=1 Tax=Saccharospirillum salsuginis TaxID=418750 RepID=A0A918KM84_9GAMM|nr:HipA N-terminal domain-containing protein [Saccharospirillum salsuginis]GGX68968.1 hypothetical protein GCM10007392_40800 [Saccharospirillum salsuginis]
MRRGNVYYNGQFAGVIEEDDDGTVRFAYDPLYRVDGIPIAFSMPLTDEPYLSDGLPPFFENLVSEGWLRRVQSQTQHIDETDSFGLLLKNGRDLVGAVSVIPAEEDQ